MKRTHLLSLMVAWSWNAVGAQPAQSSSSPTSLNDQAQAIIDSLPNKTLSLDFVVQTALRTSDSYSAIRSEVGAFDVPDLRALIPLEWKLEGLLKFYRSEIEYQVPEFSPLLSKGYESELGLTKAFSTGTSLKLGLKHTFTKQDYLTLTDRSNYETRWVAQVSQSLWKNFLGTATRKNLKAAHYQSEARKYSYQKKREDWFLQLAELYYRAWVAQGSVRAAQEEVDRRERLRKLTQLRLQRGTSEKPDLLQIEASVEGSLIGFETKLQTLRSLWNQLVAFLSLPSEWYSFDPIRVPLAIDDALQRGLAGCQSPPADLETPASLEAKQLEAAALSQLEAARANDAPSVDLLLGLESNDVDPKNGKTWGRSLSGGRNAFFAGAKITVPLGFVAEKADFEEANALAIQASALARSEKTKIKVDWINACEDLQRWKTRLTRLRTIQSKQGERVRGEENRFRLGRAPMINLIQAEQDFSESAVQFMDAEMKANLVAWSILRLSGDVRTYLDRIEATP